MASRSSRSSDLAAPLPAARTVVRPLFPNDRRMCSPSSLERTPAHSKVSAARTFFRQWLQNPLSIAALAPSGRQLTRRMIAELPRDATRVVEFGAGTGVFTRALVQHGIAPVNLLALELNEPLYQHLAEEFPDARVFCGDARRVKLIASACGFLDCGKADAVISGLGLLSMSRQLQLEILGAAVSVLKPGGCFIQFTYGPTSPVPRAVRAELRLSVRRGGFAFWNLPPACVYVYTLNR